jgi:hypothetical protein
LNFRKDIAKVVTVQGVKFSRICFNPSSFATELCGKWKISQKANGVHHHTTGHAIVRVAIFVCASGSGRVEAWV